MPYAKIILDTVTVESIGDLPAELVGLEDVSLADLGWVDPSQGFGGIGYWPVVVEPVAMPDLYSEELILDSVDEEARTCRASRGPRPAAEIGPILMDAVRVIREAKEVAGIYVDGQSIRTDEKSQNKVVGALKWLDLRPAVEFVEFEAAPTIYVDLPRAYIETIGGAIGDHVQACHKRSRILFNEIRAAMAASDNWALVGLDIHFGWPEVVSDPS